MIKLSAITILTLLLFSGCSDKNKRSGQDTAPLPEAMQSTKSAYSKRGYEDQVNSIFHNLLDKSPSLKRIDGLIGEVLSGKSDSTELALEYLSRVNHYYASASTHLGSIKDSVLKEKVLEILALSRNSFASESRQLTSMLDSMNLNTQRVQDRFEILKVLLTLPVMKEYEKNNRPSASPMNGFMRQQQHVERLLDSAISVNGG